MTILPPPGDLPPPPPYNPPPLSGGALADPPLLYQKPLPPEQPLPPEGRDERGRFAAGNPGKPPGTRNRTTIAIEALMEGQWDALTKTAIAQALRGDTGALRLILDRIAPVRRGSAVEIPEFPKLETVADVPKAHAALVAAVAAGLLSADEAAPISGLLTAYITAVDIIDTAAEVAEIKKLLEEAGASKR
jgi:hypothetical protein